ncbi:hypothetical protein JI721_06880 [Alicyclobacillus cycloheptanicus]|uniref:Uncharacterized protein n=1 Tax=Alicyclobacillus cycloheptanicus TaxID=1457 RepID=A0ABT9XHM6_9BACL|nr:hypothetical protein [Alicyclobacillus cycloheptanicus]MDQ0189820.1 hypothetical protein [Alicyclobacillus cycloheptanicus]WDM02491.1 hypothetical protein JI721_06880 [Alicyclobacillus cycloheptanicus]
MKTIALAAASAAIALTVTGCAAAKPTPAAPKTKAATPAAAAPPGPGAAPASGADSVPAASPNTPVTFFAHAFSHSEPLSLHPDPVVQQAMPDVPSPTQAVVVYLPVYPGAVKTSAAAAIGDMGTPMDADLLDGSVYFKSKHSPQQLASWYQTQLRKLGYVVGGHGSTASYGKTTSTYEEFEHAKAPGAPTQSPDISLGFLSAKQNGETVFKLKAFFIVVPPRPSDTYLPTDIVKVVLTEGKAVKTITDPQWIARVVKQINALQVSTPGMSSGLAVAAGTPTTIHAAFYGANGSVTSVTYQRLTATLTVGTTGVALNAGAYPALLKDLASPFA